MLQNQLANYGDKMFDKDTAAIVRNHALWGAIVYLQFYLSGKPFVETLKSK